MKGFREMKIRQASGHCSYSDDSVLSGNLNIGKGLLINWLWQCLVENRMP